MPLTIKCSRCKFLIYYTDSVEGLEEIGNILENIRHCPNCGRSLLKQIDVKNISVKMLEKITQVTLSS